MGSTTANSAYGKTFNPWNEHVVPGGSSGGSASCVAARLTPVATATDTGGSIRQPAAFCGVTGIKPTYGRPSRWGMIAFASSLDTAGVIAQTAEDCALVLSQMIGFDKRDSTSIELPPEDLTIGLNDGVKGLRIGVPRAWIDKAAPALRDSIYAALKVYEDLGAVLVDIKLEKADLGVPVYYIIAPAEASSNLGRFDGVRYGHRAQNYTDLLDMIKKSRDEGFGPEPKRRILIGTYVLSHGYYDAYYIKAQQGSPFDRRRIRSSLRRKLRRDRCTGIHRCCLPLRRQERSAISLPERPLHRPRFAGRSSEHERSLRHEPG